MKLGSYKPLPGQKTSATIPDPQPIMHYKVFKSPEDAMFVVNRKYLGTAGTCTTMPVAAESKTEAEIAQPVSDVIPALDTGDDAVEKRGRKRK